MTHCTTARGGSSAGISDSVCRQKHGILFVLILISPWSGGQLRVGGPADSAAAALLLFLLPGVLWTRTPPAWLNLNFLLTEVLALLNHQRIIVLWRAGHSCFRGVNAPGLITLWPRWSRWSAAELFRFAKIFCRFRYRSSLLCRGPLVCRPSWVVCWQRSNCNLVIPWRGVSRAGPCGRKIR